MVHALQTPGCLSRPTVRTFVGLIGALAAHWWHRAWSRVAAIALVVPVVLTGALVVLRLLPWTPPEHAIAGPYTIAYVELKEGPRVLTNLVDCDFNKNAIDAPARLVFKPSDGGAPVPFFTLA